MKQGTQIAYIPYHANGNINHPDVEFGFVYQVGQIVLTDKINYFCRFWRKNEPGTLRTVANSKLCKEDQLIELIGENYDRAVGPCILNEALDQIHKEWVKSRRNNYEM